MNRDKAIRRLKNAAEILQMYVFDDEECIAQDMKDYNEALKMAIEALSADAEFADLPDIPRAYYERIVRKMAHEINMLKEQLESADAVSRKDIIGYIDRVTHSGLGRNKALEYIRKYVERTESADTVIVHTEKEENENSNKEKV